MSRRPISAVSVAVVPAAAPQSVFAWADESNGSFQGMVKMLSPKKEPDAAS